MQKAFYMEAIIRGNKLGHKMLTNERNEIHAFQFLTRMHVLLQTETGDCVRHSAQKCKHLLLTASASQHSALQIPWEVSCAIKATAFLSDLSLQPYHAILRLAYQLSDCSSRCAAGYPQKHKSLYPWGILFQPSEASCQKELA